MTEAKKRILLVEDEPHLLFNLEFNLRAEGFDVVTASDGLTAVQKFSHAGPFDLILLDVMLPEMDGYEVARQIRKQDKRTGILMLTARAANEDRVTGLESGVDDYITKPFHLKELMLRVKRMAERAELFAATPELESRKSVISSGPFTLDVDSLQLRSPSGTYTLTALEADILREFMTNPGRVLSREQLLDRVWGVRGDIETRTVDNFIVRLRRYLETDPSKPAFLLSVRGRGYKFHLPG